MGAEASFIGLVVIGPGRAPVMESGSGKVEDDEGSAGVFCAAGEFGEAMILAMSYSY